MFTGMIGRVKHLGRKHAGGRRQELSVSLDEDSMERLKRLRTKLRSVNESQLIALALKSLEQKIDRIIRRQVRKNVPVLVKKGLGAAQIAKYFNRKGIPAPGEAVKWDKEVVSDLLDKKEKSRLMARFEEEEERKVGTGH